MDFAIHVSLAVFSMFTLAWTVHNRIDIADLKDEIKRIKEEINEPEKEAVVNLEFDFGYGTSYILTPTLGEKVKRLQTKLEMLEKYLKIETKDGQTTKAKYVKKK